MFPLKKQPLHLGDQEQLQGAFTAQSHSLGLTPGGHRFAILNDRVFEFVLCR